MVSGGFDPIHSGHINMFNAAKELGDILVVGVNSDEWLRRKKTRAFMSYYERSTICAAMSAVNKVLAFDDSDGSACDLLNQVKQLYPTTTIIFANGGDRTSHNIPELKIEGIKFEFGVGGYDKANSSSIILDDWSGPVAVS